MDIVVLGSIALDTVETPAGTASETLGGSATYFAFGACHFSPVYLVSVIGSDFPRTYMRLFHTKKICTDGIEKMPGKTFRWHGFYGNNLNDAQTRKTELNVLKGFTPYIPASYRTKKAVFLANFDPEQQLRVLMQMHHPQLIACDTMNLWIATGKKELLKLLSRVDIVVLNDAEAKQLTGDHNLFRAAKHIKRLGPQHIVIKKGEHGCMLYTRNSFFIAPCYPVENVCDPTGAGDTFAGGFFGYLASKPASLYHQYLIPAVLYGSVLASFTVEAFSLKKLLTIHRRAITSRFNTLKKMLHI